jgi:RimJ/RimL family protein N-acetyltransferase
MNEADYSAFPDQVVLNTQRLTLRKMTLDDVDNLQLIFSDPIAMKYYPRMLNRHETIDWINKTLDDYEKYGHGLWTCHLKDTHEFVGQCGLVTRENVDGKRETEVGYLFVRKYWNQGYATEAAKACMEYGNRVCGLNRIISLIRPVNEASRRVAVKNGFKVEKEIDFMGNPHIVYAYRFNK